MCKNNGNFLLSLIVISSYFTSPITSAEVSMQCEFKSDDFDNIANQYTCNVQVNLMILTKDVEINLIQGSHQSGKSINDVKGLSIRDKRIAYFPKNLSEKFKSLIAIRIRQGRLKEISQKDLKPFPKLRYVNFDANDIEVLESDLFEYNPELEVIWFEGNRIKSIGSSVFENLKKLRDLDLEGNNCVSKRTSNKADIPNFLSKVAQSCTNLQMEISKMKNKMKEVDLKNIELMAENEKVKNESFVKEAKILDLNKAVSEVQAKVIEKIRLLQQQQNELESIRDQKLLIEFELNNCTEKSQHTLEKMKDIEEMLQKSVDSQKTCMTKITELEIGLDEKSSNLLNLQQKFNFSQTVVNSTRANLEQLQEKLKNLVVSDSELRQNVTGLIFQLEKRDLEYENLTNILEESSIAISGYTQEIHKLSTKLNESEVKISDLDKQRAELSIELSNISSIKHQMEIEVDELLKKLEKSSKDFEELLLLNHELSDELANITQNAEPLTEHAKSSGLLTLILIAIVAGIMLTIINIVVALKFYRTKTIIVKPIEIDDSIS